MNNFWDFADNLVVSKCLDNKNAIFLSVKRRLYKEMVTLIFISAFIV